MKIAPNSNSTDELGLTAEDEQALESVGDLRASLGIPEGQHLTSEILQAALKKKGQAATTARLAMAVRNRDHKLASRPTTEYNTNHYPAGSPKGGQFAPKSGGGGGVFYVDSARREGRRWIGRTVAVRAKDEASAMAAVRSGGLRARIAWPAKDQTGASIPTGQWLIPLSKKAADTAAGYRDSPSAPKGSTADQLNTLTDDQAVSYWNVLQIQRKTLLVGDGAEAKRNEHEAVMSGILKARGIAHEPGKLIKRAEKGSDWPLWVPGERPSVKSITKKTVVGNHPVTGALTIEPVRQNRRKYWRVAGQLTDEKHAQQTLDYWHKKGWLKRYTDGQQ